MGDFAYGDSYYGLRAFDQTYGVVFDASALATAAATTTASAGYVIEGSANTVQAVSTTASAAVEIIDASASISSSATNTCDGVRVGESAATVSATATNTSSAEVVYLGSSSVSAATTTTASGVFSITVAVSFSGQASVTINYIRRRKSEARTVQGVSGFAATARKKWEPLPISSPNIWTTGALPISSSPTSGWATL
jgi:hypothetical protein